MLAQPRGQTKGLGPFLIAFPTLRLIAAPIRPTIGCELKTIRSIQGVHPRTLELSDVCLSAAGNRGVAVRPGLGGTWSGARRFLAGRSETEQICVTTGRIQETRSR